MSTQTASARIYREAPEFQTDHLGKELLFRVRVRAGLTLIAFGIGVILPLCKTNSLRSGKARWARGCRSK